MGFTIVAVFAGLVVGLARGGRLAHVGIRPLRGVGALGAAVVLQALPSLLEVSGPVGLSCILGSYVLLGAFAVGNIRLVGMPVVLTGLLLNVFVITLNGGMPVRLEAILTVDRGHTAAELSATGFDAKRHLQGPGDRVTVLGDVLPVPVLGQVLSFGDVILAFGIGDLVFRLLKPAAPIRRRRRPSVADVIAMLPAGAPASATELSRSA